MPVVELSHDAFSKNNFKRDAISLFLKWQGLPVLAQTQWRAFQGGP